MPDFLSLNGWRVPVLSSSGTAAGEKIGDVTRSVSGQLRRSTTAHRRRWDFQTIDMTRTDGEALARLLMGEGDRWSFDADLYSGKGRPALAGVVASIVSGGRFGSAVDIPATTGQLGYGNVLNGPAGTVSAWHLVALPASTADVALFSSGAAGGAAGHIFVRLGGVNEIRAIRPDGTAVVKSFSTASVSGTAYQLWTLVWDAEVGRFDLYLGSNRLTDGAAVDLTGFSAHPTLWLSGTGGSIANGVPGKRDDLLALPAAAPEALISALAARTRGLARLPRLEMEGSAARGQVVTVQAEDVRWDYRVGGEVSVQFALREV